MCDDRGLSQDSGDHVDILEPFCKRYGCPKCVPILRRRLQRKIREGKPTKLITLTLKRVEGGDPVEAAAKLMWAWTVLVKQIRRHLGKSQFNFLHVKEGTKNGWPHLHVPARCRSIDHEFIRDWWKRITGDYEIDIRPVRNIAGCAKYLSKYLTKDLQRFGTFRVWSKSKDWTVAPEPDDKPVSSTVWDYPVFMKGSIEAHLNMLQRGGYYIVPMGKNYWRAYRPHDRPQYAFDQSARLGPCAKTPYRHLASNTDAGLGRRSGEVW